MIDDVLDRLRFVVESWRPRRDDHAILGNYSASPQFAALLGSTLGIHII